MNRLLLLALLPLAVFAQSPDEVTRYFVQSLQGQSPANPGRPFPLKKLDGQRTMVWQAWCQAHQPEAQASCLLPQPDSLNNAQPHHWKLPEELEPQAVMPFYFGRKGQQPEGGYPLFLYLHGSGPKASEWQTGLLLAQRFDDAPSLYFIPQIPNEGGWYRWWQRSKQYAWEQLLQQALMRPDVDPDRVYVFGISEGGYGSQRIASFYADYLAGAGPMAGGEPLKNAPVENVGHIGFSLLTGADDRGFYRNLLTHCTAEALDSLEELHPAVYRHRVKLIEGKGHHIDYAPTTPWLLHFVRNPWPKHFIWEDFEMDGRHRTGFYNLLVHQRPDSVLRTRYDFDTDDNNINITVENVTYTCTHRDPVYGIELQFERSYSPAPHGHFTLLLNEHLVDLKRPVTVTVNGKTICKKRAALSVANLINSAMAFGDPRRLYPAAVDVKW